MSLLALPLLLLSAAPPGQWVPPHRFRTQLVVTAPADGGVPGGYSLRFVFDHATEVDAGRSRLDGSDVRVHRWSADAGWLELDRVLDSASTWNRPATVIWLATPGPVPLTDDDTYLYWGGAPPGAPREAASGVFLFADDFESGDAGAWATSPLMPLSDFEVATGPAHSGQRALRQRVRAAGPMQFGITLPLPPDVVADGWFLLENPGAPGMQVGWIARLTLSADQENVLRYTGGQWDIAERNMGAYSQLGASVAGPLAASTWRRVAFGNAARHAEGSLDGVVLLSRATTGAFPTGTVGLARVTAGAELAPDGGNDWLIDDVRVRRWIRPEPTIVGAGRVFADGEPCTLPASCASAACTLNVCGAPPDAGVPDAGVPDAGDEDGGLEPIDAGTGAHGPLVVGCGCQGSPVSGLLLLAALTWLRRRSAG